MPIMNEILTKFDESPNDIKFLEFNKKITDSIERPQELKFILEHFSYITVNGYLKILGNDSENGFIYCNELFSKCYNPDRCLIAYDILGGLFAINIEKLNSIEYFAPDTLEWEDLEIDYKEFLYWVMTNQLGTFYQELIAPDLFKLDLSLEKNEVVLTYPFIWSMEYTPSGAVRKIVPFKELLEMNADFYRQLSI
ncbi:DUF2625 family protein [Streptococcus sp. Marseille-Q0941]|uniref:DUF2625 family protein n=1 Tax=Streptococcus sp. Marseille-Q0941 TaxID=2942206 RepID=UPI0020733802|nr:DUF2625 family protein [Streptococcus sp. Marseille-Q0941]